MLMSPTGEGVVTEAMHYLIWCYGKKSHKKDLTHVHNTECIHFPVLVKFLAPYICLCSAMLFHDTYSASNIQWKQKPEN